MQADAEGLALVGSSLVRAGDGKVVQHHRIIRVDGQGLAQGPLGAGEMACAQGVAALGEQVEDPRRVRTLHRVGVNLVALHDDVAPLAVEPEPCPAVRKQAGLSRQLGCLETQLVGTALPQREVAHGLKDGRGPQQPGQVHGQFAAGLVAAVQEQRHHAFQLRVGLQIPLRLAQPCVNGRRPSRRKPFFLPCHEEALRAGVCQLFLLSPTALPPVLSAARGQSRIAVVVPAARVSAEGPSAGVALVAFL
jgi:hypothetical protein